MQTLKFQFMGLLIGAVTAAALAQPAQNPIKKAVITRPLPELKERRNAFAGNESQIATMNYVNMDCTSGPLPDVRVVTPPASGELRFDQIKYAVYRKKDNSRSHCNGKIVDAVGVFYRSKPDFAGADKVVVDVDFRDGNVRRFVYSIEVR
jgi:hypothetical protein